MKRRNMIFILIAATVLAPLLVMAIYVEDWSRDLTTNVAWTDSEAEDIALRPIELLGSREEIRDLVQAFGESRPNWTQPTPPAPLPKSSPLRGVMEQPDEELRFHLIRTSRLIRYQDDVWIIAESIGKVTDTSMRWLLHAHSQSRIGKGDLGQNPRNVRELLTALREAN